MVSSQSSAACVFGSVESLGDVPNLSVCKRWDLSMASNSGNNGTNDQSEGRFSLVAQKMSDPILQSLRNYWEELRDGRLAPFRSEIDPRKFEDALENMFILEKISDDSVRVRLAGMKLCEMMGMEVRGMAPRSFMMPEDRVRFDLSLRQVFESPAVKELVLESVDSQGKSETAYMMLLPLRSDFGDVTRILGCVADRQQSYLAPLRFRITAEKTDEIQYSEDRPVQAGFAEEQALFGVSNEGPQLRSIAGNPHAKREKNAADRPSLKIVKD